ncbi:LytR C-terminal domain-containing protein [Nocardia higoensis]|uniref:LytR C-terminal domain-containing protein n=1 Tax=Nocardia higoensis TaxID=228599 RepID=A0ABS0DG13_9NOCA|nr:LytR C-terminal domain-containing protein [Nocardia higoensis]MBF6357376.1 LytR C-terminal domain-containing protein [Nocardia higoensis]
MSYPNPTSGGPPLRALAMVLIALAIVFAGLGAMSMSSSDSDGEESAAPATSAESSAPATAAPRTTAAPATEGTSPTATTVVSSTTAVPETPLAAPPASPAPSIDRSVPVQVLNNSLVVGLAGRTAEQLTAAGWTNVRADNYAADTIAETTVYYGNSPGEKAAAEAVAAELGAAVAPKPPGLGNGAAGVVVILTGS